MKVNPLLRKYVSELKSRDNFYEYTARQQRRELIANNSRSGLERKLASMQIKDAICAAVASPLVGGIPAAAATYFYNVSQASARAHESITPTVTSTLAVFFGVAGLGGAILSLSYAAINSYRAARNYVHSRA